jgi:hypothetical protein
MRVEVDFILPEETGVEEQMLIAKAMERAGIPYVSVWEYDYRTDDEVEKDWFRKTLDDRIDPVDHFPYFSS